MPDEFGVGNTLSSDIVILNLSAAQLSSISSLQMTELIKNRKLDKMLEFISLCRKLETVSILSNNVLPGRDEDQDDDKNQGYFGTDKDQYAQ